MSKIFNIKVVMMLLPLFFFVYDGYSQGEINGDCSTCCDGIDNDGDGFVDWDDFGCKNFTNNPNDDCPWCPTESSCSNGVDDDGDGLVDGSDPDCQSSPSGCTNTIWIEDFEGYIDGTMNTTKWTTTYNDCDDGTINSGANYWGVQNGEFRVNDIEGTCSNCINNGENDNQFLTEVIDISTYTDVSLFLDVRVEGAVECATCGNGGDLFTAQYRLDGGSWNTFYTICGANDGFQDLGCIDVSSGSNLEIRILVGNQANDENYYFDNITVCGESCSVVLPIELMSFEGEHNYKSGLNELKWITASEANNDRFEIYSSNDGEFWEIIGVVNGAGNSTTEQSYRFNHKPKQNLTYYRLKQIDFNGNFEYSNIISISKKEDKILDIKYYDLLGKELLSEPTNGLFIKIIQYEYRTEHMRIFKQ